MGDPPRAVGAPFGAEEGGQDLMERVSGICLDRLWEQTEDGHSQSDVFFGGFIH